MLTPLEIFNATRGAIRLLRFDPAGVFYFDNTLEAFWRSFRVLALVAPIYVVLRLMDYGSITSTADDFQIVIVETLRYLVEWFFYPVALFEIARWLPVRQNYLRYIVAFNWIKVPLLVIALVLFGLGELVTPLRAGLRLGVFMLELVWFCAATRLVLGASWPVTFGLLVLTVFMSIVLNLFVGDILGLAGT
jgi:hypothetical protein